MSSSEEKNWRDTFVILLAVSTILTTIQHLYGPLLIWSFQLFVFYIPTALSLAVYVFLRAKNRRKEASQES